MTSNQIAYWNYHEDRTHNRAVEGETKRHNVAMEGIERAKLALNQQQLKLNERIADNNFILGKANSLIEQQRVDNQNNYWVSSIQETKRSNIARESETNRHNLETEIATTNANLISGGQLELGQRRLNLDVYSQQWEIVKDALLGRGTIFDTAGKAISLITGG